MARTPCAYPLDETGVSAVSLRDEVNEGAKFRRHLAVLRPEDLTYPRLGFVVRQQDLEPSGGDVFGKHLVPHQDDAGAGERGIADRECAVDGQAACEKGHQWPTKVAFRFSTNARTASLWSRVRAVLTMFSASKSRESRNPFSMAWSRLSFMWPKAIAGPSASETAIAKAVSRSSASGTTRLIRPMASARRASTRGDRNINSRARENPVRRVSNQAMP